MNPKSALRSICLLLALILPAGHAAANSYLTANAGTNQSWGNPATWQGDSGYPGSEGFPESIEDTAELTAVTSPSSLTLDGNAYIFGSLTIDGGGTAPWAIISGGSGGSVGALAIGESITDNSTVSGDLISADISLNGSIEFSTEVKTTVSGDIGGSIFGGTGGEITVDGNGTLVLSGDNSYSNGTVLDSGILQIASEDNIGGATAGGITLDGGELLTTTTTTMVEGVTVDVGTLAAATGTTATYTGVLAGDVGALALLIGDSANAGTVVLTNAETYSGGTFIQSGTLDLDASTGSLVSGSNLTFSGTGTFNYDNTNTGSGTDSAQTMGTVAFNTGDGTVVNTLGGANSSTLTFSSVTRSTGATGNFVINDGSGGSTNGAASKIVITGQATGFMDPGLFFNGSNYATYDSGGFVRGINYATDTNAVLSGNGANGMTGALTSDSNVLLTEDISNQISTQINTLNMGSSNLALGEEQTLTLDGILESGGSATISGSGGSRVAYVGAETEEDLVVRTDLATDVLTITTAVTAPNLTKSGAGTLNLNGGANIGVDGTTGTTYVNDGTLGVGSGSSVTSNVNVTGTTSHLNVSGTLTGNVSVVGGTVGGGGTVDGGIIVGQGGSTYPGDPQILTANNVEYQNGSTAQFSIASAAGSSHPPTAGTDYDQMNLVAGSGTALQIDTGITTLQLNMSPTSLAYLQSTALSGTVDDYFLFTLGAATSSGQFTDLTLVAGGNTYTETIVNGVAFFSPLDLAFDVSYTGIAATDSLTGGNDVAVSVVYAVPEPGTWALLFSGIGLLMFYSRRRLGKSA